jgi:hypothetical protein
MFTYNKIVAPKTSSRVIDVLTAMLTDLRSGADAPMPFNCSNNEQSSRTKVLKTQYPVGPTWISVAYLRLPI